MKVRRWAPLRRRCGPGVRTRAAPRSDGHGYGHGHTTAVTLQSDAPCTVTEVTVSCTRVDARIKPSPNAEALRDCAHRTRRKTAKNRAKTVSSPAKNREIKVKAPCLDARALLRSGFCYDLPSSALRLSATVAFSILSFATVLPLRAPG